MLNRNAAAFDSPKFLLFSATHSRLFRKLGVLLVHRRCRFLRLGKFLERLCKLLLLPFQLVVFFLALLAPLLVVLCLRLQR